MIIQALCEYYQRKAALGEMPPYGFEWKPIPYLIIIKEDGSFVKLEETYEGEEKRKEAKCFCMCHTKDRSGSSSWAVANSLWDHYGYVLGLPKKMDYESEKAKTDGKKQNQSFVKEIKRIAQLNPNDKGVKAICLFYESFQSNLQAIKEDSLFEDSVKKDGTNFAFKLFGESEPIGADTTMNYGDVTSDTKKGLCIITGSKEPIAILHNKISLLGANSTGAKLVGFQKNSGYDSYHREQGMNAPISDKVNYAYTTALNELLNKKSKNHFYFSGDTLVFWASKENNFESQFPFFFSSPPQDNPDKNVEVIRELMEAPLYGTVSSADDTRFYILLLSPNVARIAVRLWEVSTVGKLAGNIRQYFKDLDIIKGANDKPFYSLFEILRNIALQYDPKNLPPMLFNGMMRAAIKDLPLPALAQLQCIGRIKADRTVNSRRAGLLKAYLNRKNRINKYTTERNITMALDLENTNQAYLCGRLFAILEKIQDASGISTIRERYYGAASRTPSVVFPRLLALSNHHLAKLSEGQKIYYEQLKGGVMDAVSSHGFPAHLSLDNQSRFAIGYYHQRQAFFTKKNNE
jgi:CRISPR-associated protein Csd1